MGVHNMKDYTKVRKTLGIPEDEPIFILRAQDMLSIPTIARYDVAAREIAEHERPGKEWFESLEAHQAEFAKWQAENLDKVKIPD